MRCAVRGVVCVMEQGFEFRPNCRRLRRSSSTRCALPWLRTCCSFTDTMRHTGRPCTSASTSNTTNSKRPLRLPQRTRTRSKACLVRMIAITSMRMTGVDCVCCACYVGGRNCVGSQPVTRVCGPTAPSRSLIYTVGLADCRSHRHAGLDAWLPVHVVCS
jgi:hypothetical protein